MAGTTETTLSDEDSGKETAKIVHTQFTYRLIKRLLFPTGVLIFCLLYVKNTYGRIALENLLYPYIVISVLLVCLSIIYVADIRKTINEQKHIKKPSVVETAGKSYQSLSETIKKQKNPIIVSVAAIVYPLLIEPIGYFPASALILIGTMRATGTKNWIRICGITVGLLLFIYIMFVQVFALRIPEGILAGVI